MLYTCAIVALVAAGLIWWVASSRELVAAQRKSKKTREEKRARFLKQAAETPESSQSVRKPAPGFGRR